MRVDDIEGATPNAFGKVRDINGRDYMTVEDIPGAKPRYLAEEQRRADLQRTRQDTI